MEKSCFAEGLEGKEWQFVFQQVNGFGGARSPKVAVDGHVYEGGLKPVCLF